jgi:outer membrane protein, heavy metal efflux system
MRGWMNLACALVFGLSWHIGPLHAAEPGEVLAPALVQWAQAAQGAPWADPQAVHQTLAERPAWQRALMAREAAVASSQGTEAGSAEWSVDVVGALRRSDDPAQRQTREWALTVQRPWRSSHKGRLAAAQADVQRTLADLALAQAWRQLQSAFVDDLAEAWHQQSAWASWQDAERAMHAQAAAMRKRTALGDASELDARQMEAALAQAQSQARQAQWRLEALRQQLHQRWPRWSWSDAAQAMPWPAPGAVCQLDSLNREAWAEAVIQISPDVRWAQAQWQHARLQADVDAAQRSPDPSFGIQGGQAGNGAERHVGLTFSLPFGGEARHAQARASVHQMAAAQHGVDDALMQAREQALSAWSQWEGACAQSQSAQMASDAQALVTQAMQRSHALGEGSLQSFLLAQASGQDLARKAEAARIQAWLTLTRVLLLAGGPWPSSPLQPAARASGS